MTGRVRVLRVIARMNIGGPALQVQGLMENLDTDRFEQLLVTGAVGPDERDALDVRESEFPVERVDALGRRVSFSHDLSAARELRRVIRRYRPDIVHTHTAKAGFLGRLIAQESRVPITVHTFHGHLLHGYFGPAGTKAVVLAERALAARTTHLLAVGNKVRQDLLDAGVGTPERFSVMPPGIPVPDEADRDRSRASLSIGPDQPVVSIVGRMVAIKRPDRLAETVEMVSRRVPDLVVLVAGSGPGMEEFKARAAEVDVRYLGWRSDVSDVHAASDLSLQASDNEGTPISLIEAGMAGRPVVAADVGSVSDVVVDGETGILRTASAEALASAVVDLLGDPPRRNAMGLAASKWTRQRFSAQRLSRDHADLYSRLLEGSLRR